MDAKNYAWFISLFILAQLFGITMIIMVVMWMSIYQGGLNSWATKKVFNYHSVFMPVSMVFLYGDAILIFRLLNMMNKYYVKIAHGVIQVLVLVLATVGLVAVFQYYKIENYSHLYTIHSWLGLISVALFSLQWIMGFVSFLFPKLSEEIRKAYLPHHRFFGLVIFIYCCATSLIGLAEASIFDVKG